MYFSVTLYAVLIMFIVGAAGFIFKKAGLISEHATKDFSKILIYICQPCLIINSFCQCKYSEATLEYVIVTFVASAVLILSSILVFYLLFKKKYDDINYRVYTFGASVSNFAFFGIPILQAIFPDKISDLMIVSATAAVVLNLIGWTLGCFVISGNKEHISFKKILINPALIGFVIALPLFFLKVNLTECGGFAGQLGGMVETLSKMTTPVFMLVLGIRLASSDLKGIFCNMRLYLVCFVKQVISPLIVFAAFYFIPVSLELKQSLFVIFACPVASVVLNYAELVGEGQGTAANLVLLSVLTSIVTLPLLTLMLGLF